MKMTEWTDKHYDFTYKLTEQDISDGEIKVDPYFVGMVWKTGGRDDSGALFHIIKTCARFGEKNPIEREIKALYAQVKGLARVHGVELEDSIDNTEVVCETSELWYPDNSGEWVEYDGEGQPTDGSTLVTVLLREERHIKSYTESAERTAFWNWVVNENSPYDIVAYKVVK